MKFIIYRYKIFIVMLFLWFLLNFNFHLKTIITGIIFSAIVSVASFHVLYDENGFMYQSIRVHRLIIYFFILFYEIFKSSFIYVINIIKHNTVPIIFDIVLDVKDPVQVGIIANSITLTPGTITIDINDNIIKVMVLAKPNTPIESLEAPIRNRFEKLLKAKEKVK